MPASRGAERQQEKARETASGGGTHRGGAGASRGGVWLRQLEAAKGRNVLP